MASLNFHSRLLQRLCRICGHDSHINGKKPTPKAAKRDIISKALDVDVNADSDVFPTEICDNCRRGLDKWWEKNKKKAPTSRPQINLNLYDFREHSDSNCIPCTAHKEDFIPSFMEEAKHVGHQHGFAHWEGENGQHVFVIIDTKTLAVTRSCVIFHNLTWKVEINEIAVTSNGVPDRLSEEDIPAVFTLACSPMCIGNPDFRNIMHPGKTFCTHKGVVLAYVQDKPLVKCDDGNNRSTIRYIHCQGKSQEGKVRCNKCEVYRADLSSRSSQQRQRDEKPQSADLLSSHARHDTMPKQKLQSKIQEMRKENTALKARLATLQQKTEQLMAREGIDVIEEENFALKTIVENNSTYMDLILEKDTPQRLLWDEQKKYLQLKDSRRMRWHPAIIRWCIALHAKSPVAFKTLRESGFIHLPHQSTLFKYTHFLEARSGINDDVLEHILEEAKLVPGAKENNITLVFDEMKIKSGLVFSQRTGAISGFTETGTVNEQVSSFERRINANDDPPIASYVLAIMARGIFSSFKKPIAYYPCTGFSGVQLFHVLWDAVEAMESLGFHVRAFVSDGASPNRKFYQLHEDKKKGTIMYCTPNPVNPARNIYFICDVPHLMKTTRNCFENSGWNSKTRNLRFRGKDIRWQHIVDLFDADIGKNRISPGLRKLHKLTNEHVRLQPSLRMRVYLAAQVLSRTVADALESHNDTGTQSTELFIRYMDTFFDCLNVSNAFDGPNQLKLALFPYRSMDDPRFKWLTQDFLNFLDEWEAEGDNFEKESQATAHPVKLSADEKKRMCLSPQTLEGLRITVYAVTDLIQALLSLKDVEYVLTEKFSQDPLEEYFSKQRGSFGFNDNPTSFQFGNQFTSLLVQGSAAVRAVSGNCRNVRREEDTARSALDPTPLKRRKLTDKE